MHRSLLKLLVVLALGIPFGACSGGSVSADKRAQPDCGVPGSESFCLTSCNLGCSQIGCSITDIAQNQPIILTFSQDVDPSPVNLSSISLKTAMGHEPVGSFVVQGSTVMFLPEVRLVGGASFFGFKANETYILRLSSGPDNINALRSTSGDPLVKTVECKLHVTRGVVDLDRRPPEAKLIVPAAISNVKRDSLIVIEFSELVNSAQISSKKHNLIDVRLRKVRPKTGGGVECNPRAPTIKMDGSWRATNDTARQVTVAVFKPLLEFPGEICVEVQVTKGILDLARNPGQGQLFQFITEPSQKVERQIVEAFDNDENMDADFSSGVWGNGEATPGILGWDGLHGEFDLRLGRKIKDEVYEWNTDNILIPKTHTLSGKDVRITDGVFRFSSFSLPRTAELYFVGSKVPQIYVRGSMSLEGKIFVNGVSTAPHMGTNFFGQPGGVGGCGGATGGKGAEQGDGKGHQPKFNGSDGGDARLPAGHAYAGDEIGTGGKGAPQFPSSGQNFDINYKWNNIFSAQMGAGGGGAGYTQAGTPGKVTILFNNDPTQGGPPSFGGKKLDLFPLPSGRRVFDHFLIGGAAGAGGSSHPFLATPSAVLWRSGAGGGGGGGALGIRVGRDMLMAGSARVEARGGGTGTHGASESYPAPGGAGAGGALVFQVGGSASMAGVVDVRSGLAGKTEGGFIAMESIGGSSSPGYLRLEVPGNPSPNLFGQTHPSATSKNVAPLTETDVVVGARSKWYSTKQVFPPDFVRYEIQATVKGKKIVYSDDPAKGILADENQAVQLFAQAANVDASGEVDKHSIRGWRQFVGPFGKGKLSLADDGKTGFRFLLLFHRNISSPIVVKSITFIFST